MRETWTEMSRDDRAAWIREVKEDDLDTTTAEHLKD
jgi:hypothetical protein